VQPFTPATRKVWVVCALQSCDRCAVVMRDTGNLIREQPTHVRALYHGIFVSCDRYTGDLVCP
jgi:hypothetical protein